MASITIAFVTLVVASFAYAQQCADTQIGSLIGTAHPLRRVTLPPTNRYYDVVMPYIQVCRNPNGIYVHVCDPDGQAPSLNPTPPNKVGVTRNPNILLNPATFDATVYCP